MKENKSNNYEEIEAIIANLDFNYKEEDKNVVKDIYKDIEINALNISKLKVGKERLIPIIKKYTRIEYMRRGNEGISSSSENGINYTYEDVIKNMKQEIIDQRLRRIY